MARTTQSTTRKQPVKSKAAAQPKTEEIKASEKTETTSSSVAGQKAETVKTTEPTIETVSKASGSIDTGASKKGEAATKSASAKKPETAVSDKAVIKDTEASQKAEVVKSETAVEASVKVEKSDSKVEEKTSTEEVAAVEEGKVKPVPEGYSNVTPTLIVQGAAYAIEYYTKVFGAKEVKRVYAADGISIANAALQIGDAVVHICDEMPAAGILSPASMGAATSALQLYLEDVDVAWSRALTEAAYILLPLEDVYWGERTGKLIDPFGHVWILSQKIEDLTAEEVNERYQALYGAPIYPAEMTEGMPEDAAPDVDISKALAGTMETVATH